MLFLKTGQLHSQDSLECNWIINIDGILKIDTVMVFTTKNI